MNLVFALSAFISILPFPLLTLLYDLIPAQVPLFVDLAGNPTVMASKSLLSVFRLPTMGLMIQVICIAMFSLKFSNKLQAKTNSIIWLGISLIGALKMSLTSMEVLIFGNEYLLNAFRIFIWITVLAGVALLLYGSFVLYKEQGNEFLKKYQKVINKWQYIAISIALVVYIIMVFIPKLL
ncbi:MAG: hypothetical protein ACRKFN_10755 [Desulfitobacterium sp.]